MFAIWGLIYVAMLAYSAAQFVRPLRDDTLPDLLAAPIIAANTFNVLWLWHWHHLRLGSTVVLLLGLLVSLIAAYLTAHRERTDPGPLERWAVRAPISLYLGWVSVATIANLAVWLFSLDWRGGFMSETAWTVVMIAVGTALAAAALWIQRDLVFAGVFVWAFVGIAVKQADVPAILVAGIAAAVALLAAMVVTWMAGRRTT